MVGACLGLHNTGKGALIMARKVYSKEFQDEACRLARQEGYTYGKAAKELGINLHVLKYWLKQRGLIQAAVEQPWPQTDDPKLLKARIHELETRLRRSETEKEILKKATAFFASQNP
jgi:transposase